MHHYTCMVNLLDYSFHLDETRDFTNNMPIELYATMWTYLFGTCKFHT